MKIVAATRPVDFRKGHDGLVALAKNELRKEPFTGPVFVFRSKRADRLKLRTVFELRPAFEALITNLKASPKLFIHSRQIASQSPAGH